MVEALHPVQRKALMKMSPAEKWQISLGLLQTATETRLAALRKLHPEWSGERLQAELAAERLRG